MVPQSRHIVFIVNQTITDQMIVAQRYWIVETKQISELFLEQFYNYVQIFL